MNTNGQAPAGNRDYLDKGLICSFEQTPSFDPLKSRRKANLSAIALDAAQKKIPGKAGDRFREPGAADKNRAMNEKITDFVRKQFEKMTGKKVPSKVSN
ncbi:MAG: hypothetical protein Q9209_000448 [Squamulea sp. 1 TL-2023]